MAPSQSTPACSHIARVEPEQNSASSHHTQCPPRRNQMSSGVYWACRVFLCHPCCPCYWSLGKDPTRAGEMAQPLKARLTTKNIRNCRILYANFTLIKTIIWGQWRSLSSYEHFLLLQRKNSGSSIPSTHVVAHNCL